MKEEHYLSCEKCGISLCIHQFTCKEEKELARHTAYEHEAKCLPLKVGQQVEFMYKKANPRGGRSFTGVITAVHKASAKYHSALVFVRSDEKMYEPSHPEPEKSHEQGRDVLVKWRDVLRIL